MKSVLRNYISCIETDQPQGIIHYLEPVIKSESPNPWTEAFASPHFTSYSEIGLETRSLTIAKENYQVKSSVSLEQARDIQGLHGINVSDMLKSTLINEMEQMVEKKIREKMKESAERCRKDGWSKFQLWANKWFGYSPKVRWSKPDELASLLLDRANRILTETRMGGTPFVLVSPGAAVCLEDSPRFTFFEDSGSNRLSGGNYEAGILAERIKVLVDPYMRFNDHEILMGIKSDTKISARIFMVESPEPEFMESVDELRRSTTTILRKRFGIESIESKNYTFIDLAEQGKKHNLFTHLISKIFKK